MIYHIDQSGKMESAGPTVLALSNDETQTFWISAQQKQLALRRLEHTFYKQAAAMLAIRLFAHAVAILVALVPETETIVIDMEYTGQENRIRQIIRHQLQQQGITVTAERVRFQEIGRAVTAHRAALAVFRGERKADHKLKAADLLG
jgi:hypothetical protein